MLRKTGTVAGLSTLVISNAFAGNWIYQAGSSESVILTGGYGAVADTQGNFYNDGLGDQSYDVILDSGSSGFLMSNFVQSSFNVPLINGASYPEQGIGGTETTNVTQPIQSLFSPILNNNVAVNGDNSANFTAYGTFKFEARQQDPGPFGLSFYDIIGTPVLAHVVMQVLPNNISDQIDQGFVANLAETHLLKTLPTNLPAHGVYHVPLSFQNFVDVSNPVPSEDLNPVIKNVTAKAINHPAVTADWLLDTGAQFSIVSQSFAGLLGINTAQTPYATIMAGGVGGTTVTFDGFKISEIDLPLTTNDMLVIDNPVVFVAEGEDPFPSLNGIIGEDLLQQSTDINQDSGAFTNIKAPLFQSWYLDGPGNQLVLIDPNSAYTVPEPASIALLVVGGIPLLMRRSRQKKAD